MWLLQFDNNGGPCPFFWQDLRVFCGVDMAGNCQMGLGKYPNPGGLFGHLCEAVTKGVDN